MRGGYDPERAALILADAIVLGDVATASKWNVSRQTITNYRARLAKEPALRQLLDQKRTKDTATLSEMRVDFLRDALAVMRSKLEAATLYEVAGAVKIVGELHHVGMAVDDERSDGPDPEASEAQGRDGGASCVAH